VCCTGVGGGGQFIVGWCHGGRRCDDWCCRRRRWIMDGSDGEEEIFVDFPEAEIMEQSSVALVSSPPLPPLRKRD